MGFGVVRWRRNSSVSRNHRSMSKRFGCGCCPKMFFWHRFVIAIVGNAIINPVRVGLFGHNHFENQVHLNLSNKIGRPNPRSEGRGDLSRNGERLFRACLNPSCRDSRKACKIQFGLLRVQTLTELRHARKSRFLYTRGGKKLYSDRPSPYQL